MRVDDEEQPTREAIAVVTAVVVGRDEGLAVDLVKRDVIEGGAEAAGRMIGGLVRLAAYLVVDLANATGRAPEDVLRQLGQELAA